MTRPRFICCNEKLELILIPICGIIAWLIMPNQPTAITLSKLFLYMFSLLLLQGLVRDLWLLTKQKHHAQPTQNKAISGICLESTIGITGIMIGSILLFSRHDFLLIMPPWMWSVSVITIMLLGFAIKDYVWLWNKWTIYRDKDHYNILFTWKNK